MSGNANSSKSALYAAIAAGKLKTILGWVITIFFLMTAGIGGGNAFASQGATAGNIGVLIFCIVFIAFGVWLILLGSKRKKEIKRFRQYISIISNQNPTPIYLIVNTLQKSEGFILQDLHHMINKGYFVGAILDMDSNSIIMQSAPAHAAPNVEMRTAQCQSCGAPNRIAAGAPGICEYCGSTLDEN